MLNEFGEELELFNIQTITEDNNDDVIQVSEDEDDDSYEMMGVGDDEEEEAYVNGEGGGGRFRYGGRFNRRGGEDKMADAAFFNSFEDDFDDQDLL